jgi:hypothetical protein
MLITKINKHTINIIKINPRIPIMLKPCPLLIVELRLVENSSHVKACAFRELSSKQKDKINIVIRAL